ncbi:MAG: dihydrolipoyllysine-residue succinyltransferase [Verrucomicrobiaceae bacterium]|nr:MAG: dihydrolipoyllysine-residue succinyltransferase [Verrucomicrobiaceae bacterium]
MNIEVKVPAVGESISSGVLSVWHKKEGDTVRKDDTLFTLETDKVSQEVTAPEAGVVHVKVAEGDEVKIGQVVAEIEPSAAKQPDPGKLATKTAPTPSAPVSNPAPSPAAPAVPAAAFSSMAPSTPAAPESRAVRKKLSPLRRKIAAQLVMAQHTAAILTTFNECDMTAVMALRKDLQEQFTAKHGVKLGFMSFFIKAVVDALQAIPAINSRIDGDDLILNNAFDIGVAVGTERGLIVPVLRECEKMSFAEIENKLAHYAVKAREGKVSLDDLQGGIFTISNGGIYGSLLSTPILNPPQSGILGMHKIQERPVVMDGKIVARPMMYLALSYDHRLVDGKEAVTFLIRVKDCIENPVRLFLDQ